MGKNYFIVLDGIDGAGKGEIINRLHNYLFSKSKSCSILTTREPTSGIYGSKIRDILKKEKNPSSNAEKLLELYIKDREEHLEITIEPFLSSSGLFNIVLCDRYYYSTIAFQHSQGIPLKRAIELNKHFLKPDICFILDLPASLAFERISKAGREKEKFEQLEFMEKIRENFLNLKSYLDDNIIIIDASKPKEDVFEQVRKEIDNILWLT